MLRALLSRLRRPSGRSLKVTRAGRTYLVVTIGVGLGALNTGNNLLYLVLGLLLSMVVVSGVLSESALKHVVVRRLGADAAFAGDPCVFRYAVSVRRGTSFALAVQEHGLEIKSPARVAFLRAGEEQVSRADLVAPRRGPHALTAVEVTTTFPLGLFAKTRRIQQPGLLLVYPRRGFSCADQPLRELGPAGDRGNPHRRDGTGDLLGLRELAEGEDARRVHWRKSAAVGRLLRTEREREERRQYVLRLDDRGPADELDRSCEETAAAAHRLLHDGNEVGLETQAMRLRPTAGAGQERRILTALAWLGYDGREED